MMVIILICWLQKYVGDIFLHIGDIPIGHHHNTPECDVGDWYLMLVPKSRCWWRDFYGLRFCEIYAKCFWKSFSIHKILGENTSMYLCFASSLTVTSVSHLVQSSLFYTDKQYHSHIHAVTYYIIITCASQCWLLLDYTQSYCFKRIIEKFYLINRFIKAQAQVHVLLFHYFQCFAALEYQKYHYARYLSTFECNWKVTHARKRHQGWLIGDIVAQREQCPEKIEMKFSIKIDFFAHFEKQGSIYGE